MSKLQQGVNQYLTIRRALGFQLNSPARVLQRFVRFAESENAESITIDLIHRWSKQPSTAQPATWGQNYGIVRGFADWYSATDCHTEVLPKGLLPYQYRRQKPYIYSDNEIARIIQATAQLPSTRGLRGLTYSTFFALMACTGMRISEALALDRDDVDLENGILTIRHAKFGKSRLLPLHSTSSHALSKYAMQRDRALGSVNTPAFFLSNRGKRITEWSARYTFARISQQVGIRPLASGQRHGRGPRPHDLRHRFAVRVLIGWYRAGYNVEAELPRLATYLGHVHIHDTYWYIEGVPELLQLATERLQRTHEVQS